MKIKKISCILFQVVLIYINVDDDTINAACGRRSEEIKVQRSKSMILGTTNGHAECADAVMK